MKPREHNGACLICGGPLSHLQTIVCSFFCRATYTSSIRDRHSDETREKLRVMWGDGLSTAEIGRRLHVTKNVVVSLRRRMGLPARGSPIKPAAVPPKPRVRRVAYRKLPVFDMGAFRPIVELVRQPPPAPKRKPEPTPNPTSPHKRCQWIDGDTRVKPVRYCDAPAVLGYSYCADHCRRAYVNWQPRAVDWATAA